MSHPARRRAASADTTAARASRAGHIARLDERLRWLAVWTIHNANHLRESRDGLKVGGHQASCASMSTIMAALYFHALRPEDRVAVKPHASPLFHAAQYLFGRQDRDQLERFRAFGGAQSYPSRTKDKDDVDFSTGSVGLGVAVTAFASLAQDYLHAHGWLDPARRGRMIALMGDAELDEGNIYECLIEAYKHDIRNCWWIVDYNRQSLDSITADRMFERFDDIFRTTGWRVVTLKYGKALQQVFARPGGRRLREWIDTCPNADYAALSYQGGKAWRARLKRDLGAEPAAHLVSDYDDDTLHALMTGLGGHCPDSLIEAFDDADDDRPTLFIAYTVKGRGLPFEGHKDNHAGILNPAQVAGLRERLNIEEGEEWGPYAGLSGNEAGALKAFVAESPFAARDPRPPAAARIDIPPFTDFPAPAGAEQSTQAAFGRILLDLAKTDAPLASRIVTMSPDVTVSTNLGGFVNQRGLFRRESAEDVFHAAKIPSAQKWAATRAGQHVELGIAENNLFLALAAFGLAGDLWGERLIPIGTVYDPFIARGLDALNYACYQDARFILAATPSGLTLGPEGGAHQSVSTPLIGMAQPGLTYIEPAFVDELAALMHWALTHVQEEAGGSVYFRLSTRTLTQTPRTDESWRRDALRGGYWLKRPAGPADAALVFCGAVAPEAIAAADALAEDLPGLGVLNVVSPGLLHRDWMAARRSRWTRRDRNLSHAETLLSALGPSAGLVTLIDGAPAALSWLGGVLGHRVSALGVDSFGQSGDLPDLYAHYRLDADAVVEACADLFL
ncbi:MAG: transketolase [Alphaproteobacteria bacterium]|nr:transketolase [Alphaproteobacteria bacterium]